MSQRLSGPAFSTLPGVLVVVLGRVAALWLARESGHGPSASRELGGQCRARRAGGGAEAGAQPGAAPGGGTDRDREGPGGPGAQRAAGEKGAGTAAAAACSACPRPGNRSHQLTPPGARGGSGFRPGESLRPRRLVRPARGAAGSGSGAERVGRGSWAEAGRGIGLPVRPSASWRGDRGGFPPAQPAGRPGSAHLAPQPSWRSPPLLSSPSQLNCALAFLGRVCPFVLLFFSPFSTTLSDGGKAPRDPEPVLRT